MNQHVATSKQLLSLKLEGYVQDEEGLIRISATKLRSCFVQMYAAGYDEGRTLNNYKRKEIGQFSAEGKFMGSWPSRKAAARATGFPITSIWRSMAEERPVRGYLWKYL